MQGLKLGLEFKRPLEMNHHELYSLLDCYSAKPRGNWPVQPKLRAPLSHYQACYDLALHLQLGEEQTIGQYLLGFVKEDTPRSLLEKVLLGEEE
ncbi:MAG: hypothetical protein QT08_C0019G0022 [archaeon GW2011_AR17]|nr:MAG: hypothetical protein QT08_C0019G0022 [archaeon GW2011_AR17]MBS3154724.1 hypothetical protein [Candidatus Woesearchaeota archaeon]HIH15755.1 hypothetical protein [Nanoarchaeota archaeon]HIH58433.1 hypothetical protein [Nanoarchaeota archaeon]HII13717.1 hypothetical protein [Nanoarchaeota archaeon]